MCSIRVVTVCSDHSLHVRSRVLKGELRRQHSNETAARNLAHIIFGVLAQLHVLGVYQIINIKSTYDMDSS